MTSRMYLRLIVIFRKPEEPPEFYLLGNLLKMFFFSFQATRTIGKPGYEHLRSKGRYVQKSFIESRA